MADLQPDLGPEPTVYRPGRSRRLWQRRAFRAAGGCLAVAAGLLVGGCSFSYQLGSLMGKDEDQKGLTGTLGARRALMPTARTDAFAGTQAEATLPGDGDLAVARTAIAEALGKSGTTASASWENPATGARGTVTPLTAAYKDEGRTCRDFLASHVRDGNETWLEGGACRIAPGRWEVRRLKPWKRA